MKDKVAKKLPESVTKSASGAAHPNSRIKSPAKIISLMNGFQEARGL